jgi:protein-tyrosine phosphatase
MDDMNRVILLEGARNFRDMGGYSVADGRRVRRKALYRSDHLASLTSGDLNVVAALGIRSVLDFRSPREIKRSPDRYRAPNMYALDPSNVSAEEAAALGIGEKLEEENVRLVKKISGLSPEELELNNSPVYSMYRSLISGEAANRAYRAMLKILLDSGNVPALMHCRGGKDRTGVGAAIVLYLLGVSMNDIVDDYLLTGILRRERNEFKMDQYRRLTDNARVLAFLNSLIDTKKDYIETSFSEMVSISGSVDAYMEERLSVTEREKAALRSMYLEPDGQG